MAVSRLLANSGANDFNLNVTGATTAVTFDREYASGSYSITSSAVDITLDFYAYNAAGTLVGYTATKAFTASSGFNKIVVLGGTAGDVIGFTFKKTFTTSAATAEVTAGPVVTGVSPSAAPNVDGTVTVTGANFASDVTVHFTGTGYTSTAAKSIVRTNSTSLIVTRPDNFPITGSPYTITVSNPGVSNPSGSSVNILANSVTAGVSPAWSTAATLPIYTKGVSYTTTVVATDADAGSTITYSTVTSTLPTGLTHTNGVISGTASVTTSGGITIRATDGGGNFVDRAFTIANVGANAPAWTTAAGALTVGTVGAAYSFTLVATDDSGVAPTYSIASGALPTGLTLSAAGVISGTPSASGTSSFTVNATDANGTSTSRAFSIQALQLVSYFFGTPPPGNTGWSHSPTVQDCVTFNFSQPVSIYGCTGGNGTVNGTFTVYNGTSNAGTVLGTTTSFDTDPSYGGRRFYFPTPLSVAAGSYTFGYHQGSGSSQQGAKSGSAVTSNGVTVTPGNASFGGPYSNNGTDSTSGTFGHVVWLYI